MTPALVLVSLFCQQPSPATLTPESLVAAIEARQPIDWKGIHAPPYLDGCVPETIAYAKPEPQRIVKLAGHPSTL